MSIEEPRARVTELGYMGIGVRDLDAWKAFARDVVGLQVVDAGADGCFLRMDYWHHRIAVHRDDSDDLAYLGLRVAGADELELMRRQLGAAGIEARVGSPDEAAERRVLGLLKLADPNGNPLEIFHGPEVRYHEPFHPGRGMHGRFKTDAGGMGHCFLHAADPAAAGRFYAALGMRGGVEYQIRMGAQTFAPVFMHCNDRDHTIALAPGQPTRRIHHLMLEVDTLDDVGLTHDLVRRAKVPVDLTLGKHANDQAFTFYFRNPSGWTWEYGWGSRPATYQSEYYVADVFGHQFEAGGFAGGEPKR
jgi:2,3-dihydroxyethylbenzene 1,2-dioxygenase